VQLSKPQVKVTTSRTSRNSLQATPFPLFFHDKMSAAKIEIWDISRSELRVVSFGRTRPAGLGSGAAVLQQLGCSHWLNHRQTSQRRVSAVDRGVVRTLPEKQTATLSFLSITFACSNTYDYNKRVALPDEQAAVAVS